MGLGAVSEAGALVEHMKAQFTEKEKEFILWFAFQTEDKELTVKLMEELREVGVDKEQIICKYQALVNSKPEWITRIENLLIALEMYRVQEEKAIKILVELLRHHGIAISEEAVRKMDRETLKQLVDKKAR